MNMEPEGDAELPRSCSAVRIETADMGNGVMRITSSRQATIAEAKAFMADAGVLTMGSAELEGGRGIIAAAFNMAGVVRPLAYVCAVRAINDDARESFIWAL
jgi:hypothetical protein